MAHDYYANVVTFHRYIPIYNDSIGNDTAFQIFQENEDYGNEWIDTAFYVRLIDKASNRFKIILYNWMYFPSTRLIDSIGWIDKEHIGRYLNGYWGNDSYYDILYESPDTTSRRNYVFFLPETPFYIEDWANGFYKVKYKCGCLNLEGWINRYENIYDCINDIYY